MSERDDPARARGQADPARAGGQSDPARARGQSDSARARGQANDIRKRQRSRATVLAIILGAFVILVFAISIAKIQMGMGEH